MEWITAIGRLTGRCKDSRKLCNNTYLCRRDEDAVAVRLHSTDVVTFFSDGRIEISTGGWNTITTKDRINACWKGRVWSESGHMFASYNGQECAFNGNRVTVLPDGTLVGDSAEEERKTIREEINERNRPRNRARYWTRKAREGKPYRGTVESIMQEENVSVRVAKMTCYGIEKFFLDAKAKVLDEKAGYQLLELPLDNWQNLRALKMACTTTNAVYINSVPPHIQTVPEGLDWMFNTTDYLGTVSQQA